MALQTQIVSAPFAQGLDTKTDPLQIPGGKNLVLENAVFQRPKELRKRFGYAALPRTLIQALGSISAGQAAGVLGDELVMGDGQNLYSYNSDIAKWRSAGAFIPALLKTQAVNASTDMQPQNIDCAYDPVTGLKCFIWSDGSSFLFSSIVDTRTGEIALTTSLINLGGAGVYESKVVAFSGSFAVFFTQAPNEFRYIRIDTATLAIGSSVNFIADMNPAAPNFDVMVANNRLYFAYNSTGGGNGITTGYFNAAYVLTNTIRDHTKEATGAINIWPENVTHVWVAWSDNAGVYALAYNSALTAADTSFHVDSNQVNINQITGIFIPTLGNRLFYCSKQNAVTNTDFIWTTFDGSGVETVFQNSASIMSKAFIYGSNVFLLAYTIGFETSALRQSTYFLFAFNISTSLTTLVGKVAPSLAPAINPQHKMLAEAPAISAGVFQLPYVTQIPQKWAENDAGTLTPGQVYFFYGATLDLTVSPQSAEIANSLHFTGAQLWLYDGLTITEHGFHMAPVAGVPIVAAGAGIAAGTYIYIATYSWSDAQGQTHTSAPSAPRTVVLGAPASTVSVPIDTLRITNKTSVRVNLYRTAPSITGGTLWYAVGSVANNKAASTVFVDDIFTDAQITVGTNPQLYTNSGEVPNASAPACRSVATYKSRLLVVPSDDAYSWWFSKPVLPSSGATIATPAEFSNLFIQNIDQKGGPLTGVISMDDKIILAKATQNCGAMFYVTGDGPALTGANNDFSTPQIITSPVGVGGPANSMVLTPGGVMFQAQNGAGIWMLDRGLGTAYIGAPVEYANGLTVLWGTLIPEYNQVRFLLSNGTLVVYDYFVSQWSTFTNYPGLAAVVFEGNYGFLQSDGSVQLEDPSLFTDNGTPILRTLTTGWLDLAALSGFQRVRRVQLLGTYYSPHVVSVAIAYDYDGTIVQTDTINVTAAGLYEFLIHLARQKCESIQITIADVSGAGEGARWSGLTFEVGQKKGLHKLPPTAAYG